ncbi:MAG: class I SAM-dependent methyltransferase [Nitrospinae bacterium]|nr:class I SAM-dependent methyltransferase [Nitrospinota bacterium]
MHDNGGGHGAHVFDPKSWMKLESPERRAKMDPEKLADIMGLTGEDVALDIGCGTGFFAQSVAPRVKNYYGVDISEDLLDVFRSKIRDGVMGNVVLKTGNATAMPVESGCCSLAFHVTLFHEIESPEVFHAEIRRVLKPGGRLFAVDWHARDTGWGPPVDHRRSVESAIKLMTDGGFAILKEHGIYKDHYVLEAAVR